MVFLVLSVLCSAINIWLFKVFERYNIPNFQAIVYNYFICVAVGLLLTEIPISTNQIISSSWLPASVMLGLLFIGGFNLIAITTQRAGVAAVTVASKVSMVMPVAVAIMFYGDAFNIQKVIGIVLVIGAIFFTSVKSFSELKTLKTALLLPLLVWLSSGIIEIVLDYAQRFQLNAQEFPAFLVANFGLAGLIGLAIFIFMLISGKAKFSAKSLIAGIALGIPNYFSLFFLLKALKESGIESSSLFPIANICIVLLAIIGGVVLFKERLTAFNWIGVGLAIAAITIMGLS